MAEIELPRYRCHKEVRALKIEAIADRETGGGLLYPVDKRYAPIPLSPEYVQKHKPEPGGYYVVYKDGYKSFSPAQAFEEGYTLVR